MKWLKAGILDNVVSVYDQTKTTIKGNVHSKNISTLTCLGPALNKWIDVVSDSGITPFGINVSSNGRIFTLSSETGGVMSIALHTFNFVTGATSYVGKITINVADTAATTHTLGGFKILDNAGTTGWKIFIATRANVAINGGLYLVNKVDLADFTFLGTNFPTATGNDYVS